MDDRDGRGVRQGHIQGQTAPRVGPTRHQVPQTKAHESQSKVGFYAMLGVLGALCQLVELLCHGSRHL
jgi:hypothetical protein